MTDSVTIYLSDPDEAIARLAQLDGVRCPSGPLLAGAVDGRLLAAVPLAGGRPIADPFARTAGLVALLEQRVAQLDGDPGSGRLGRLVASLRGRSARGARARIAGG